MRPEALALMFLLFVAGLAPPPASGQDYGDVGKVNRLISVFDTPQLAPGESGAFRFEFNSTYAEPIYDVTLNVSIYMYATIEEAIPVDSAWSLAFAYPRIEESTGPDPRDRRWALGTVGAGTSIPLEFTVLTAASSEDMPHGSVFSEATYFVRFWLEFNANVSGTLTPFVMKSRGHFTGAQWDAATNETNTNPCNPPGCRGNLNLTLLGVDGLLPDSSFGVKEPIPQWPFYALIAAAALFLVFAFLSWVEENPGTFPRVDAWWARMRGRFARFRRTPKRAKLS